jgi:hypothetical protein
MEQVLDDVGQQELTTMEAKANTLEIDSDANASSAMMFIADCKAMAKRRESQREELVRPHLNEQRRINDLYKPVISAFESLAARVDAKLSTYRRKKQLAIEEANRKAIAEVDAIRREQERKAEAARQEAERLKREALRLEEERIEREIAAEMAKADAARKEAEAKAAIEAARQAQDKEQEEVALRAQAQAKAEETSRLMRAEAERILAEEEQKRLEKAAAKLEVKADHAEARAMTVAPVIQSAFPKTMDLGTGEKVTSRKIVDWCFANGVPKDTVFYRDDPRFKNIPDSFFRFDPSLMTRQVKAGVKPEGVTVTDATRSVVRGMTQ